jgi:hypothetical protein
LARSTGDVSPPSLSLLLLLLLLATYNQCRRCCCCSSCCCCVAPYCRKSGFAWQKDAQSLASRSACVILHPAPSSRDGSRGTANCARTLRLCAVWQEQWQRGHHVLFQKCASKKRACKRHTCISSDFAPGNNQVLALRCAACAHAQTLARGARMRRLTVDHSQSRRFPFCWRLECRLLLENSLDLCRSILCGNIRRSCQQREGVIAQFEAILNQGNRSKGCKSRRLFSERCSKNVLVPLMQQARCDAW